MRTLKINNVSSDWLRCLPVIIVAGLLLAACSTTRRIPDDEILYNGLKKIEIIEDSVKIPSALQTTIHNSVNVPPNNYWKLLGWHYPFPLGLW
ncbi:MAG: hypothetical protein K2I89_08615, partial [Muribaculaceae bacterium]|nr:hypothetical protein [Muribaculaceae bacterium]